MIADSTLTVVFIVLVVVGLAVAYWKNKDKVVEGSDWREDKEDWSD